MLQLTSRGNYGIFAVYYIAEHTNDAYISIDEIAEDTRIPKPYLSKILQDLCRGGILLSRRGSGGGFALARSPRDINLKDVIEVIEGKIYLVNCLLSPTTCGNVTNCPIAPIWVEVQKFVTDIIASITLEDIVNTQKRGQMLNLLATCQGMYREKVRELIGRNYSLSLTMK